MSRLAIDINALYAMCENPRNFHGMDLVKELRSETSKAMKFAFNLPLVTMTLCIAEEANTTDYVELLQMYQRKGNNRIGLYNSIKYCNAFLI